MDNKNNNYNGTSNGFLMGVIVGAATTLLFTTKKGREIAREMADKALEKFSDLEIALEEKAVEMDEIEGGDYIDAAESIDVDKIKLSKEVKPEKVSSGKVMKSAPKTKVKRYFRLKKNS